MTLRLFALILISFVFTTSYSQSKIESLVKNLPRGYEYQLSSDTSIINREIKDYVEDCWDAHKNLNPFERIQIIRNDKLISTLYFFNDPENETKIMKSLGQIQKCNFGFNGHSFKVGNYIVSSIGNEGLVGGRAVCLFNIPEGYKTHNDHDCLGLRKIIEEYFEKL